MEEIIKSEYEDVYRVTDGCNSSCEENKGKSETKRDW